LEFKNDEDRAREPDLARLAIDALSTESVGLISASGMSLDRQFL
jgi:hypothetical protein